MFLTKELLPDMKNKHLLKNPISPLEREIKSTVERRMPYSRKNFENESTIMKSVRFLGYFKERILLKVRNQRRHWIMNDFFNVIANRRNINNPPKLKTSEQECPEKYRSCIKKSLNLQLKTSLNY